MYKITLSLSLSHFRRASASRRHRPASIPSRRALPGRDTNQPGRKRQRSSTAKRTTSGTSRKWGGLSLANHPKLSASSKRQPQLAQRCSGQNIHGSSLYGCASCLKTISKKGLPIVTNPHIPVIFHRWMQQCDHLDGERVRLLDMCGIPNTGGSASRDPP